MINIWFLYRSESKRIAVKVGSFKSDFDYACHIEKRANNHWLKHGKRGRHPLRKDKYKILMGNAGQFTEGW